MTVATLVSSESWVSAGTLAPRSIPFPFIDLDDLRATYTPVSGSVQVLVRGTHYTITGNNRAGTAVFTPLMTFTAGGAFRTERVTRALQEYETERSTPLDADSVERELDRQAMRNLEQDRRSTDIETRAPLALPGQIAPDFDVTGLVDDDLLTIKDGKLTRFAREPFAGKFFAGGAGGVPVPSSGLGGGDLALRTDLATEDGDLLIVTEGDIPLREKLASKGPVSTKSSATGAAAYPVDHRLGRDHPPHPFEFITNATTQNGIIAGTSTTDVSSELQAMLNGWNPTGGKAGIVDFPVGRYPLGEPMLWPNWLSWRGGSSRGHQFFLLSDHTGPYAFQFDSDPGQVQENPSSQFQQRLIGFDINCNSAANVASVIYAPSWNEKCGLSHCMMRNIPAKAFHAVEFHGGSAGFQLLDNCEFFFDATATIGFDLVGKGRSGTLIQNKPIISINNSSVVGGAAPASNATSGFIMFSVDNVHLNLSGGIHLEKAWIAFSVSNGGTVTGFGLTGSDDGGRIKELFARGSNHTGWIDVGGIENGTSSGTRVLRDFKTSINATLPDQGRLQVPSPAGVAWASGSFRTSGGAISGTPELVRCASVTRDATGYYKVIFTDTMFDGDNYTVRALATSDTDCRAHVRDSERTGGQFFIRVYRISDSTLFDPDTVTFEVIRRPGL